MTRANRTKVQIEANALDLEIFRLRQRMDAFARMVNSSGLAMDAMHLGHARPLVWRHMHPVDREAISGVSDEPCLSAGEKAAQAARCPCHGADDYCVCQNAADAETRKARRHELRP